MQFSVLCIEKGDFNKKYKKMMQPLQRYFYKRKMLIEKILSDQEDYFKAIKKQFYSTVEKGKISVFLKQEMKMHVNHANPLMKKKLHKHFLMKEIDSLKFKKTHTKDDL